MPDDVRGWTNERTAVRLHLPLELTRRMAFKAIALSSSRHSCANTIYTIARLFHFMDHDSTFCLIMRLGVFFLHLRKGIVCRFYTR